MVSKKRRSLDLQLTLSYPWWMTASQAKREMKTLINQGINYMEMGPNYQTVDIGTIKAKSIRRIK